MPEVSVIIPVYNVEKYLNRCIDSVIYQTYQDFEIVLIDDGSTDASGEICDKYAMKDSRIKVIHKKNGGLSDARNVGMDNASGNWIVFIDSDDFIEKIMLEVLYDLVSENDVEIAACGINNCYDKKIIPQYDRLESFVCSGVEALKLTLIGQKLPGSICNKMIKSTLAKKYRFIVGKFYEDAFFTPDLLLNANNVAVTTQPLYNYWHRSDSITTEVFSDKKMDIIYAYIYTKQVVQNKCPELIRYADFRLYWSHFIVLDSMLRSNRYRSYKRFDEVVRYLKKNWIKIVVCPFFRKERRLSAVVLKCNVFLYRILLLTNKRRQQVND